MSKTQSIFKKLFGKTGNMKKIFKLNTEKMMLDQKEFTKIIELERDRVHRGNKQFTVVLFAVEKQVNGNTNTVNLIKKIFNRVRKIDQIGWYDNQHIGVLLPNTDKEGADIITKDIIKSTGDKENQFGIVTMSYPE